MELCWQSSSFSIHQSTFMQNLPGQLSWLQLNQPCCCCLKIRLISFLQLESIVESVRVQQYSCQQAWRDPEIITLKSQLLICQTAAPSWIALLYLSPHSYNIAVLISPVNIPDFSDRNEFGEESGNLNPEKEGHVAHGHILDRAKLSRTSTSHHSNTTHKSGQLLNNWCPDCSPRQTAIPSVERERRNHNVEEMAATGRERRSEKALL